MSTVGLSAYEKMSELVRHVTDLTGGCTRIRGELPRVGVEKSTFIPSWTLRMRRWRHDGDE